MEKSSIQLQIESLNNALQYFKLGEKLFIHNQKDKFSIASKENDTIINHTIFMKYDTMNGFIMEYNQALKQPIK